MNLALRKELEGIIKRRLIGTNNCDYKKVYIPKGWAHIKIKTFSKDLAKEIEIQINRVD